MNLYEQSKYNNGEISSIQYHSLSENTAAILRQGIITGNLLPGSRLVEQDLSEKMGVSRNVIREAIYILLAEKLLVKERNKYTRVIEFTSKDVEDIFDFRIALEQASAKRSIHDKSLYEGLVIRSKNIIKISEEKDSSPSQLMYGDMDFHDYIVKSANNERIVTAWQGCLYPMMMLLYQYINKGYELAYGHSEILEAVKSEDITAFCNEIEKHINGTKNAVMKLY